SGCFLAVATAEPRGSTLIAHRLAAWYRVGLNPGKEDLGSGDSRMTFTDHHLFFNDVEVGQEWETQGRTVTQADIVNFAGLSGDYNPIHMDHEFAKRSHFQQPIAHGLLVQSIASGLSTHLPLMRTVALLSVREWHFRGPVFIGDTIRVK